MRYHLTLTAVTLAALTALPAAADTLAGVGTFDGVAGIGSSNGDVTDSPLGDKYVYVTTAGSTFFGAGLGIGSETNGSELTTNSFGAATGDVLDLYFNYITSDGTNSYIEYAYVLLNNLTAGTSELLFTARTNPTPGGDTVPGFGLPPLASGVTLNPATTPIIDGQTDWSELGGSSGACFGGLGAGCGQTGWVNAIYSLTANSTYSLTFGVVNWGDQLLDSGLAVAGIKVGGTVIVDPNVPVVPLPAAGFLLLGGLGLLAAAGRRKRA